MECVHSNSPPHWYYGISHGWEALHTAYASRVDRNCNRPPNRLSGRSIPLHVAVDNRHRNISKCPGRLRRHCSANCAATGCALRRAGETQHIRTAEFWDINKALQRSESGPDWTCYDSGAIWHRIKMKCLAKVLIEFH